MSNESSELTFVRCSQCRNLIPAVSTKCRRCGASLEATAGAPQGTVAKSAPLEPKVVKHPSSAAARPVAAAEAPKLQAKTVSKPVAAVNTGGAKIALKQNGNGKAAAVEDLDDPLAAFLDQLEDSTYDEPQAVAETSRELHAATPAEVEADSHDELEDDYSFDDFDDELKALFSEDEVVAPAPTTPAVRAAKQVKPASAPAPSAEDPLDELDLDALEESEPVPSAVVSTPAVPKKFIAPVRQKLVAPEPPQPQVIAQPESEPYEDSDLEQEELPVAKKKVPLASRPEVASRVKELKKEQEEVEQERQVSGQLVGWLVSFSSAKGVAHELRTGKFFVSKSSIKKSDFVINHNSVSSPHAMFNITAVSSVQVQDLMSELGLFVKRRGAQSYRREEDVASLRHGDWLKFGEAEFLVSLLPVEE